MANGAPQFNPLDKPSHNLFDLPSFCNESPEDPTRPCCGPCTDWLFCLKRTPLELVLPGFDFSAWLPMVSMSASKLLPSSGAFSAIFTGDSDGSNEFEGTFLALPDSKYLVSETCARRSESERCTNTTSFSYGTWAGSGPWGWYGWWWGYGWGFSDPGDYEYYEWYDLYWDYYGDRWNATHHTTLPRTVYAPAADYGQVKNFYIDAQVKCVLNESDEPCLLFTALLRFVWEKPSSSCIGCTEADYGLNACDPAIVGAIEAAEGWSTAANEYRYCIPLMKSALIPLEGLVWEDLMEAIPLEAIEPPEWTLVDDAIHLPYWTITGGSHGGGVFPELGPVIEIGWVTINETWCNDENIACGGAGTPGTAGVAGAHETGYDCGEDEPWLPTGCGFVGGLYGFGKICIPKPIAVNSGVASIRVIAPSCRLPDGCGSCVPDPEKPHIKIPAEFSFTISGGTSCNKTFTPQASECVNIVKVYWPWGEVSDGLDPVGHTLVNTAEDGINTVEEISAVAIDDRGCIYCFTDTANCGCCEGVSGSLSIEASGEEGCLFTLTASVVSTEACPQAFLEIQIIEPGAGDACDLEDFPGACTCEQVTPGNDEDPPCEGWLTCIHSLTDGQTTVREIFGKARVRYRIWDGPCGCASDWVEFPIHCGVCECCLGTITAIYATITNWGNGGDCPACNDVNKTYELKPQTGGVNDCIWDWNFGPGAGENDQFLCDPEDPFSNWPIQAFYTIGCGELGYGSPAVTDVVGTFTITGGGGASWEKVLTDVGELADCTGLNGSHTRISNTDGVCSTSFANCVITIEVA